MTDKGTDLRDILRDSLGEGILTFLADEEVTDILLNDDGHLWVDRLGFGMSDTGLLVDPDDAQNAIRLVASNVHKVVNPENPVIDAELPLSGERFHGDIPPIVKIPTFAIRKKAIKVFCLADYVASGIMTEGQKAVIERAVKDHKNILVVGGTGSGKTTLCNAILREMASYHERIIIIEDTQELQYCGENRVYYKTSETKSIRDLIAHAMRMRPDRIVVGELRDSAALDLLKAWNSGHPGGICTIHANSVIGGLRKLEQYISEVSANPQSRTISDVVDLVIFIRRKDKSRIIEEIVAVFGYKDENYIVEKVV